MTGNKCRMICLEEEAKALMKRSPCQLLSMEVDLLCIRSEAQTVVKETVHR